MHGGYGGGGGLVFLIVYVLVICIPVARILSRVGYSGWWALLAVVPPVNVIMLWVFAYADWPNLAKRTN